VSKLTHRHWPLRRAARLELLESRHLMDGAGVLGACRSLDGTGNDLLHAEWGSATTSTRPTTAAKLVANRSSLALASLLTDDALEPNDTRGTAANLGTLTAATTRTQLVMADSNDWYRFTTTTTGTSSSAVSLSFTHALGDIDMELYNAAGQRLRISNSITNSERVSLSGLSAGTYFVRVYGYLGAMNPDYSLTVTPPQAATTPTTPTTPSTGAFDIQFSFSGLTASQRAIFEQAAQKWESIIVGDLPNATFNSVVVDDLLISASSVAIDGRGNILGQAGPDRFRSGSRLPYHGTMQFDSADMAAMEANGTLFGVILHEMGHVLGIGTLWVSKGFIVGAGTSNPQFIGTQAVAAYNAIFGTGGTGVPVENGGGSGTRDSHWEESIFSAELMTGYVGPGTNMPLSRITVGSLADLGYSVNYAMADPYTPSSSAIAAAVARGGNSASSVQPAASRQSVVARQLQQPRWEAAVDYLFAENDPFELRAG